MDVVGQTDSTLSVVDPNRMRVVRAVRLAVTPFVVLADGPDLIVGSIADNAVVWVDTTGMTAARVDVPRFLGILGVDRSVVTAGMCGDVPTLVTLRRPDLGPMTTVSAPETVDAAVGAGEQTWAAFSRKGAVVRLP